MNVGTIETTIIMPTCVRVIDCGYNFYYVLHHESLFLFLYRKVGSDVVVPTTVGEAIGVSATSSSFCPHTLISFINIVIIICAPS